MKKALWNGNVIWANEISKNHLVEEQIRRASSNSKLLCTDPECDSPTLRYCHGDKKAPYFAHKKICNCDYAKFDKEQKPEYETLTCLLKEHFEKSGYIVSLEEKLIQGHYSPFVITLDNKQIAFEYTTPRITLKHIEYLEKAYSYKNILLQWIIVDTKTHNSYENELCCIKRHLVNSSLYDNSFIQFNPTNNTLYQCKLNTVRGFKLFDKTDIPFDNLFLNETKLSTINFDKDYSLWVETYNLIPSTTEIKSLQHPQNKLYHQKIAFPKNSSLSIQTTNTNTFYNPKQNATTSPKKESPIKNPFSPSEFFSLASKNNLSKDESEYVLKKLEKNLMTEDEISLFKQGKYHLK